MSWLDDLLGKNILRNSVALPDRKKLNFIEGTGAAVTVADNPGTESTDVTIEITNAAVAGPVVSTDNGIALFDGTTGAILKDSGVTIESGVFTGSVAVDAIGTVGGVSGEATDASGIGVRAINSAGRALSIDGDPTAPALAAVRWTPQNAQPTGAHEVGDLYMSTAGVLWVCTTAGTPGTWTKVGSEEQASSGVFNLGLVTSVAASALTITLKQANGSSDPSAGDGAVTVYTRGTTAATGDSVVAAAIAATSLVVPSTATLGLANGVATYLWVYAINNAGTLELGVIANAQLDEGTRQSSTAIGTGSDSAGVLYSTVARTNVGVKLIGRILITEATAGTWATNAAEVSIVPFSGTMSDLIGTQTNDAAATGRPGETLSISRVRSAGSAMTTNSTLNVTAAGKITLTPGDWWVSAALGFLPGATTNITFIGASISKTSATLSGADTNSVPTAGEILLFQAYTAAGIVPGASEVSLTIPAYRVSVAVNTDIYLVSRAGFTVSTLTVFGFLEARRAR